ncbi:MAG: RDD family protein, partial [Thiovulaceae bacterium]|nr:RDD family protein [Sulfurimonadaceae bacterium]
MTQQDIESFLDREALTLASIQKRAVAMFLDSLIITFILIVIDYPNYSALETIEEAVIWSNNILFIYLFIGFIYQALFVYLYGATLGKMMMKIRIISLSTGDNPELSKSLNRSVVRLISEMVFGLGFLWGL